MDAEEYSFLESDILTYVSDPQAPEQIVLLAQRRSEARSAQRWQEADRLRGEIEAAGWRVVDAGSDFSLAPAVPPDVEEEGRVIYGGPDSVPSRSDEPDAPYAAVLVLAAEVPLEASGTLAAARRHAPEGTQVIVVAPSGMAIEDAEHIETVWVADSLSQGEALRAGLRRAVGHVIVVLGAGQEPHGDFVSPLVAALDDQSLAVVGHAGLRSADLRRFHPAEPGDVTVLTTACYAFRRQDALTRRPDERIQLAGSLAASWSLELRSGPDDAPPRRAVALELPITSPSDESQRELPPDHARLARRDSYRLADRFAGRADLTAVLE